MRARVKQIAGSKGAVREPDAATAVGQDQEVTQRAAAARLVSSLVQRRAPSS